MKKCLDNYSCLIEVIFVLIGGKYKIFIFWYFKDIILRFNELKKLIFKVMFKMLI